MKKLILVWHNGGRLANQLWVYASVLAYALEKGYAIDNYSFFEYSRYFNIPIRERAVRILFFNAYTSCLPLSRLLGNKIYTGLFRLYYRVCIAFYIRIVRGLILCDWQAGGDLTVTYLPPSTPVPALCDVFDTGTAVTTLYFSGWLFRNPVGIVKHRAAITALLAPREGYRKAARRVLEPLKQTYKTVIGVHIRQGDYIHYYRAGELYFCEAEVAGFLRELLNVYGLEPEETCFIICSDGAVTLSAFSGLRVIVSDQEAVVDMLILASTDILIGSDSTFGAFASYYGDKPLIVFNKQGIDWGYYNNKHSFFSNQYLTSLHY